ncbi:uncharacterized protein LOC116980953 isoform X2 [Amblyraja radiata]|uniref:uncharacterized protein LOC116980953 isoform X2 n=1 Tax=Amblyraja radiata TaxID=386614 RepID=UPI001403E88A|nr:uncharacterized protein LOC116980953 isoform X2 [Amblyraja radiata]
MGGFMGDFMTHFSNLPPPSWSAILFRYLLPAKDLIFASASAPVSSLWSLNLTMPSTSTSVAYCSALNCFNRQCKRPDLSFFRFPVKEERILERNNENLPSSPKPSKQQRGK